MNEEGHMLFDWKRNLYIVWIVQVISLIGFGFGLPFLPFYLEELGVTDPDRIKFYIGILSSVAGIGFGIMAPVWGILADKFGKKLILLRAIIFGCLVLLGMGLVKTADQLVIMRLCQGLFTGTITASAALIASNTPKEKLSYALGVISSSTFIGYSIGPAIGGFVAEYAGYRQSFFIGSFLLFIDIIVVIFFVKDKSGITQSKTEKHTNKKESSLMYLKKMLTPLMISLLFVLIFIKLGRTIASPYMPVYINELTDGKKAVLTTGIVSGIVGLLTAFSGVFIGKMGDKYNRLHIIKYCALITIILSVPLFFVKNLITFIIFYVILYLPLGGIEPLLMSHTSQLVHSKRRGLLFGIQSSAGSIVWGTSPLIGSYISINISTGAVFYAIPVFIAVLFFSVLIAEKFSENYE